MHDDCSNPWCRATISCDGITLNPWTPQLIHGGPAAIALERLAGTGVALADLYAEGPPGDEELFVRYVSHSPRDEASDSAVIEWAHTVGYRRVWLPDRVIDLDVAQARIGPAETTCRTCGLTWSDDTPEFWRQVRSAGAFPGYCLGCGASLPEWRLAPAGADGGLGTDPGRPPVPEHTARS